jgi:hypothetical protein
MGLMRKGMSISTFGLVNFRSKKEKLRRAEAAYDRASLELEREKAQHAAVEYRVTEAEKRARAAQLEALQAAQQTRKAKKSATKAAKTRPKARGRRGKRHETGIASVVSDIVDSAKPLVESVQPTVRAGIEDAKVRGRKARRQAEKQAKRAKDRAKDRLGELTSR